MIIRPEAEADLVNARDWYERQREGLGAAFLLCVSGGKQEPPPRGGGPAVCGGGAGAHWPHAGDVYGGISRCATGIDPPVPVRHVLSYSGQ